MMLFASVNKSDRNYILTASDGTKLSLIFHNAHQKLRQENLLISVGVQCTGLTESYYNWRKLLKMTYDSKTAFSQLYCKYLLLNLRRGWMIWPNAGRRGADLKHAYSAGWKDIITRIKRQGKGLSKKFMGIFTWQIV